MPERFVFKAASLDFNCWFLFDYRVQVRVEWLAILMPYNLLTHPLPFFGLEQLNSCKTTSEADQWNKQRFFLRFLKIFLCLHFIADHFFFASTSIKSFSVFFLLVFQKFIQVNYDSYLFSSSPWLEWSLNGVIRELWNKGLACLRWCEGRAGVGGRIN